MAKFQVELFFATVDVDGSKMLIAAGDEGDVPGDGGRAIDPVAGLPFPEFLPVETETVQSRVVRPEDDPVFDDGG